ncbi:MAG: hypothetical protein ACRDRG_02750 [Pseudonocardiaceae bacterium]
MGTPVVSCWWVWRPRSWLGRISWWGLDRQRADVAGQLLAPVAGLGSTTAAGLARRFTGGQGQAVETGIGDIHAAMLAALSANRAVGLCQTVTIDLDTTAAPGAGGAARTGAGRADPAARRCRLLRRAAGARLAAAIRCR